MPTSELETLERQLEALDKQLDYITQRLENGAKLSYPQAFKDEDLNRLHTQITTKIDKLLTRMQEASKES